MTGLHKGLVAVLRPTGNQKPSMPAMLTKSNRWALLDAGKLYGGKEYSVLHVPTGMAARSGGLTNKQARALMALLEEVPTPVLDALPFGQFGREETDIAKQDLLALKDVVFGGDWK